MNRPFRSLTLTGIETRFVSTRMTSSTWAGWLLPWISWERRFGLAISPRQTTRVMKADRMITTPFKQIVLRSVMQGGEIAIEVTAVNETSGCKTRLVEDAIA